MQGLLGYQNISTTQNYLGVNYADARAVVESIALITESGKNDVLYDALGEINSEILITELQKRGYNLSRLRDENESIGEIVKVG